MNVESLLPNVKLVGRVRIKDISIDTTILVEDCGCKTV